MKGVWIWNFEILMNSKNWEFNEYQTCNSYGKRQIKKRDV
jgi:hypothetical protein